MGHILFLAQELLRKSETSCYLLHGDKHVRQVQHPLSSQPPSATSDASTTAKVPAWLLLCVPYNLISFVHWLDTA